LIPRAFLHGDVSSKIATPSIACSQYYILYKDDATAYMFIHFAKLKNEALSFFQCIVKLIKCETANQVTKLRIDHGSEFCNTSFEAFLADNAIAHELSTNYFPHQNGFIEIDNRTIMEMARSLFHERLTKDTLG
jgi:hypothetical protein